MRAISILATAGAAVLLGACSTLGRLNSYGGGLADANFRSGGAAYSASLHPTEDVLLIRPSTMSGLGNSALKGISLGLAGGVADEFAFERAVNDLIGPAGCEAATMSALDESAGYWEATWECEPGVDLRHLMESQRGDLRDGKPVHR